MCRAAPASISPNVYYPFFRAEYINTSLTFLTFHWIAERDGVLCVSKDFLFNLRFENKANYSCFLSSWRNLVYYKAKRTWVFKCCGCDGRDISREKKVQGSKEWTNMATFICVTDIHHSTLFMIVTHLDGSLPISTWSNKPTEVDIFRRDWRKVGGKEV